MYGNGVMEMVLYASNQVLAQAKAKKWPPSLAMDRDCQRLHSNVSWMEKYRKYRDIYRKYRDTVSAWFYVENTAAANTDTSTLVGANKKVDDVW